MSEETKSAQELPSKRKGGMPMFVPTAEQRNVVRKLSGYGLPHEQIAALVGKGIDRDTLAKHFRRELDEGKAAASERIGATLFEKAMAGDTASLIWWTKAQMRWTSLQQIQVQSDSRISIVSALEQAEGRVIEGEWQDAPVPPMAPNDAPSIEGQEKAPSEGGVEGGEGN